MSGAATQSADLAERAAQARPRLAVAMLCADLNSAALGARWDYRPTSAPSTDPDPAALLQLQLSMHATGADRGYLACWARTGMCVARSDYSRSLIVAIASSLQKVHDLTFAAGEEAPPGCLEEFPIEMRCKLNKLAFELAPVCKNWQRINLGTFAFAVVLAAARAFAMPGQEREKLRWEDGKGRGYQYGGHMSTISAACVTRPSRSCRLQPRSAYREAYHVGAESR